MTLVVLARLVGIAALVAGLAMIYFGYRYKVGHFSGSGRIVAAVYFWIAIRWFAREAIWPEWTQYVSRLVLIVAFAHVAANYFYLIRFYNAINKAAEGGEDK